MNLPKSLFENIPWENKTNPIWLASSFILHRNLSNFNFPSKESDTQSLQTLEILKNSLCKGTAQYLKAEELSSLEKEFLVEHFLRQDNFQHTLAGQGFIVEPSRCFLATLNIEDHLQLQLIDCKGEWEKIWNSLVQTETTLAALLPFAFSPTFGYLTADPSLCGTGLTVDVYLHLPALIHTRALEEAFVNKKDSDVLAYGINGSSEEFIGDLVILRNRYTLGVSEENILLPLNTSAMKLIVLEKTARNELIKDNAAHVKDLVSRAYGLLTHSYQLETRETLDALSLIKLGVDLGWVIGISDQKINELFFTSRRAHLMLSTSGQVTDPQEIAKLRASSLHSHFSNVEFKI